MFSTDFLLKQSLKIMFKFIKETEFADYFEKVDLSLKQFKNTPDDKNANLTTLVFKQKRKGKTELVDIDEEYNEYVAVFTLILDISSNTNGIFEQDYICNNKTYRINEMIFALDGHSIFLKHNNYKLDNTFTTTISEKNYDKKIQNLTVTNFDKDGVFGNKFSKTEFIRCSNKVVDCIFAIYKDNKSLLRTINMYPAYEVNDSDINDLMESDRISITEEQYYRIINCNHPIEIFDIIGDNFVTLSKYEDFTPDEISEIYKIVRESPEKVSSCKTFDEMMEALEKIINQKSSKRKHKEFFRKKSNCNICK